MHSLLFTVPVRLQAICIRVVGSKHCLTFVAPELASHQSRPQMETSGRSLVTVLFQGMANETAATATHPVADSWPMRAPVKPTAGAWSGCSSLKSLRQQPVVNCVDTCHWSSGCVVGGQHQMWEVLRHRAAERSPGTGASVAQPHHQARMSPQSGSQGDMWPSAPPPVTPWTTVQDQQTLNRTLPSSCLPTHNPSCFERPMAMSTSVGEGCHNLIC
mmetsp:Transcript_120465/g.336080  ORF Transcript_120465/g.336080 Transcript_120465/m.336080 type:complete len:216 (+) Transcript_120465:102-749(+)